MQELPIIQLDKTNITDEHICCAISDKKCKEGYELKKKWLADQFDNGYTFKKLDVRGKVFIEYVPAEKAWVPIDAPGYMMINCFWVSGRYKGQGHAKDLLQHCYDDAKDMKGVVVVASKKKKPFMSDGRFFLKQGFELVDSVAPYFELYVKKWDSSSADPQFKDVARSARCDVPKGLSVYYTHGCPFNEYYVNDELKRVAESRGIPIRITQLKSREQAQSHFVPHTLYSVFYNGEFITQHVLNEKYFDRFIPAE